MFQLNQHHFSLWFEIWSLTNNARKANSNIMTDMIFFSYNRVRKIAIICFKIHHISFSFCLLFHLSHEQIGSHRTDFHEIWYCCIRRKSVSKIKVILRHISNNRYFPWRPMCPFQHITLGSSENEKIFRYIYRGSQNILIFNKIFRKFAAYELM